jgi:hypothetical protein
VQHFAPHRVRDTTTNHSTNPIAALNRVQQTE